MQVVANHLNIHEKKREEKKKKMRTRLNDADAVSNTLSHDVLSTAVQVYPVNGDTSWKEEEEVFALIRAIDSRDRWSSVGPKQEKRERKKQWIREEKKKRKGQEEEEEEEEEEEAMCETTVGGNKYSEEIRVQWICSEREAVNRVVTVVKVTGVKGKERKKKNRCQMRRE